MQRRLRQEVETHPFDERRRRGKKQRRHEEAEEDARASELLPLARYMETCHVLSLAIQAVTNWTLTSQATRPIPSAVFTLSELPNGSTFKTGGYVETALSLIP